MSEKTSPKPTRPGEAPDDPGRTAEVARQLHGELSSLAAFLGLDGVEVKPNGDLAPALSGCGA